MGLNFIFYDNNFIFKMIKFLVINLIDYLKKYIVIENCYNGRNLYFGGANKYV